MGENGVPMSPSSSTSSTSFSLPNVIPSDPKLLLQRTKMYESKYPLKLLIRSASGILRNAKAYDSEGAREDAFILYSRFVDLVANRIAPNAELKESKAIYKKDKANKKGQLYFEFQQLVPSLSIAMERSESIIEELKREYDEYKRLETARQEIRELQRKKFLERKEIEERELIDYRKNIERRKSSMNSDDKDLLDKLRSLSHGSFNSVKPSIDLSSQLYPTIHDNAIMDDAYDNSVFHYHDSVLSRTSQNTNSQIKAERSSFSKPKPISNLTKNINSLTSPIKIDTNHKTVNFTEGGAPLRTIFLPAELSDSFLQIAEPNTKRDLETCGILVGKLNRNAFFITHLLIPEQDSTKDTCSTKNEEKMFEFIDNEDPDLFILGWIHTHPTQSCFLSSVDLHTQNSYQIMLNEAIAIVCAPSDKFPKKTGVFRLTDPPGVPTITNCNQPGFHPHEEPDLYVDCNRISTKQISSGHVVIRSGLPFKIKDLR